jgi:peptidoglycan pentaglycine glycine transferase (the first glycine)
VIVNPLGKTGLSHFYVPRGPSVCEPSMEILGPLFDRVRLLGPDKKSMGIRVEPNVRACAPEWKQDLAALGFRPAYPPVQPRSSWMLDITPLPDDLLAGMKQKTRYNIRLASRKGVTISEGGPQDLDEFYGLYVETARRDDFYVHPKSFYAHMFGVYWDTGCFRLLLARHEGRLIAAVTLLRFGTMCWYLQGASSSEHRNLMATYLLQWEAILWAKSEGCRLYDFRAVPEVLREDQDMYGVYRFKEGFGGYQFTTTPTYAAAYQLGLFGLWQLYFRGRFELNAWRRRRKGLPARQFA